MISGSGFFEQNGKEHSFQPHDVIFVSDGVDHRFTNFTEDFATWVIFYGSSKTKTPSQYTKRGGFVKK